MRKNILSGMRPTGKLHLGHLLGALNNWVKLQEEYDCLFMVADWHALMSEYEKPSDIKQNSFEIVKDWISCGIDPERSVIFIQSMVPEHLELAMVFSLLTPLGWLERCTTYKEQLREIKGRMLATYGFLGYPVLQTADILIYKANAVPVGEDQAYHLELAREITRRFNRLYGNVFPEPQTILTEVPKLAGTDGRKMSKSFGNSILLKDSPEIIRQKISPMITDTRRKRRTDPGEPDDCPVFTLHQAFVDKEKREELADECRKAGIGCLECKNVVIESLIELLVPFREKRSEYEKNPKLVWDILKEGNQKARLVAQETMEEVRAAIGL